VVIELKWNNKNYKVKSFEIELESAGAEKLADCIPTKLSVDVEIPPHASPAKDFFNFARTQHANSKTKGNGQISVFKGHDDKKEGMAIQSVTFNRAWLERVNHRIDEDNDEFSFTFDFIVTELKISDESFKHDARDKLFAE
jgi:hypothetical protein